MNASTLANLLMVATLAAPLLVVALALAARFAKVKGHPIISEALMVAASEIRQHPHGASITDAILDAEKSPEAQKLLEDMLKTVEGDNK